MRRFFVFLLFFAACGGGGSSPIAQQQVTQTELTDSQGVATFQSQQGEIVVSVKDETSTPLQGINVQLTDMETFGWVLAEDPKEVFLPSMKSLSGARLASSLLDITMHIDADVKSQPLQTVQERQDLDVFVKENGIFKGRFTPEQLKREEEVYINIFSHVPVAGAIFNTLAKFKQLLELIPMPEPDFYDVYWIVPQSPITSTIRYLAPVYEYTAEELDGLWYYSVAAIDGSANTGWINGVARIEQETVFWNFPTNPNGIPFEGTTAFTVKSGQVHLSSLGVVATIGKDKDVIVGTGTHQGVTLMIVMQPFKESGVLVSDLSGKWSCVEVIAQQFDFDYGWSRSFVEFGISGLGEVSSYEDNFGDPGPGDLQVTVAENGVTQRVNDSNSDGYFGRIVAMTSGSPELSNLSLAIYQRMSAAYSEIDVKGTWQLQRIVVGDVEEWQRGQAIVSDTFLMEWTEFEGDVPVARAVFLDGLGQVSFAESQEKGFLSADKNMIVTSRMVGDSFELSIYLKR